MYMIDFDTIKERLHAAVEEEALEKITLEINEALARMSVTSSQNVARVRTFPDVTDLSETPDSVGKLRARNFKVGLLNPEPFIGDIPWRLDGWNSDHTYATGPQLKAANRPHAPIDVPACRLDTGSRWYSSSRTPARWLFYHRNLRGSQTAGAQERRGTCSLPLSLSLSLYIYMYIDIFEEGDVGRQ